MNAEKNEEHQKRKALKKVWQQNIKDIENALDRGEDINVAENNKRNTLLHTAVLNAELNVVKFLLNKKADTTLKNSANQTALEIAEQRCSDGKQIVSLLRKYQNGNYHSTRVENNRVNQQKQLKNKSKVTKLNKSYHYQKRTGASGINGQHYETKLLSLILFRALHDTEVEEFYLGTNVAGLGAFDDIVLRYKKHGEKETNIVFLQAKHKDDPEKDKVSVGDTLKEDGNFSLHKYLESYMISTQKFCSDYENEMFKLPLNKLNCEFLIYTPAIENFNEQTVMTQTEGESLIRTSERGKICQFHANDTIIEQLAPTVKKALAKQIGERLANFKNQKTVIMMTDEIIKVYHVFLAQHVLNIVTKKHGTHCTLQEQDNKSNNLYIEVKFRQSFHETKDEHLLLMKNIICKDLKILKGKPAAEIEVQLKSLTFEVPANFGNVDFHIKEDEKEKQKTLKNFCSIFDKLFAEDCIVEIKESDIGSDKSLQLPDIANLGSLVGNLLILDQETKLLKFNLNEHQLSDDSLKLLKLLYKNNHHNSHISRYRLDVMIPWFPKLILSKDEDDKYLVRDFLKQLKFYTNQAKEDEVEVILKKEIDVLCNLKDNDSVIKAKCDAVFLKFHAQVQSWWKQPDWTEYLTKTCQFYNEAKRDTLDSPLLSILNYTNNYKMKTYGTKFQPSAINALKITDFLKDDNANVLIVVSNEITLSSIKCFQYFGDNYDYKHTFLDLESVIRNHYLEIVEKELKDTKCSVLVIIDQTGSASQEIFHAVKKAFHGKIVLITIANISDNLKNKLSDGVIQRIDDNTKIFTKLENKFQKMILLKRELLFQDQKVSVTKVLDTDFLNDLQPTIIYKFINNETIAVGQMLTDKLYKTSIGFYINQSLCRYVTLNKQNEENNTYLYSINDYVPESVKPRHDCDIILITERLDYFEYICKENKNRNVHLFKQITGSNNIIWLKSKGQLMIKDKDRGLKVIYQVMPKTVRDIEDRMVLISGKSGMGKSTLLSHLAVHTKQKYPTMWVSKINFQDHFEQFSRWKSDNTNIDLKEVFKFLYGAIDTRAFKDNKTQNILEKIGDRIVINTDNKIHIKNVDLEADLFEIYVFNHCYNNNRVVLLFDGFDEVCPDYADEAIKFLSTLKSSKVAHIWVTTRPYNFINQLQCALGIVSFKIMPFNLLEQEQCMKKKWIKNLGLSKEMSACKYDYIISLCNNFWCSAHKHIRSRIDESFMGVPLHIYLIADNLQISFDEYLSFVGNNETKTKLMHTYEFNFLFDHNLWTLYENLIEKIFFTIHLGDKTSFGSFKDPKLRKMLEKEHEDFLNGHKKISAYTLFEEGFVKERVSFVDVNNIMENVKLGDEKAGIIECVIGKRPKFVHSTFCEYFATGFIFDILKSDSCTSSVWEYLITDIFVTENKSGIRTFINCKLSEKDQFHKTFYTKYSNEVLEILLSQSCLPQFAVAIKERLYNIVIFILKCARSAINKDNLESLIKLSSTEIGDVTCLSSYLLPREKIDGFFRRLFNKIFEMDLTATDYIPMPVLRCLIMKRDS